MIGARYTKYQCHRYVADIDECLGSTPVCPPNEVFELVGVGKVERQMLSIFQISRDGRKETPKYVSI
jgi:hypothetical protein